MASQRMKQVYAEIDTFLEMLTEENREKIPQKLRGFFKKERAKNMQIKIDSNIPIAEQSLKNETLALIAFLNMHYWCEDEEEKKKLLQKYKENDKKNE